MRTVSTLSLLLLLASCSIVANAVTIKTQDPNYASLTYTPYSFGFTTCPTADPYLDHKVAITSNGCFGAVNQTDETITSITLTFPDTPAVQLSGPDAASSDIFTSAVFTQANGIDTVYFSGSGLAQAETFVITEDGVKDPSDFPDVTLTYTTATPEPSPALLLITGIACMGSLDLYRRRRRA